MNASTFQNIVSSLEGKLLWWNKLLSNHQEFLVLMRLFRKIGKQEPTAMEIRNKCRQNGCIFLMGVKKIILIILQYLFVCGSPEEIMRIIAITVMHHAIQPGSLKRISFSKQLISVWINSHLSHVTPVWTKLFVGAQAKIWAPYPETVRH